MFGVLFTEMLAFLSPTIMSSVERQESLTVHYRLGFWYDDSTLFLSGQTSFVLFVFNNNNYQVIVKLKVNKKKTDICGTNVCKKFVKKTFVEQMGE